jgi:hypothetical protein
MRNDRVVVGSRSNVGRLQRGVIRAILSGGRCNRLPPERFDALISNDSGGC